MESIRRNHGVLTLIVCLIVTGSSVSADAGGPATDWDKASPAEIHQRLWEAKATALSDKEMVRRLAQAKMAPNNQTDYDMLFYDIFIRVDDTAEVIYGRVKFVAQATVGGLNTVEIDFYDNMDIDSIVAPTGPLSHTRANDVVTVTLDSTYRVNEQFEFDFFYHGTPVQEGFQAFSFSWNSGNRIISTLSEPYFARTWWPCKDRMDDKADSFKIAIEVDTAFYVGSNGTLDSTIDHGGNTHTFYYFVGYPMATYLFSLAISEYFVWYDEWVYNSGADTMPLVHAVYPAWYLYSLDHFDITPSALTVLSNNYGQYPFATEKYGHSNFSWTGAMEHQTMSSMAGSQFGFSTPVVVHELAHQWCGDMITCESWHDIWLNEGWASYSEALYYLETEGWASYHSYMNGMDYSLGGTIYCQDTTSVGGIFTSRVYDKGAWAVHMLRGVLGDSLFFVGVDAYYNSAHRHGSATTADFQNVFETATGVDLDWFFDEWIFGEYRPNYHWAFWSEVSDSSGYDVYVYVKQVQTTNPQVFTMPVDFYFEGPADTATLFIDERTDRFKLNLPQNVTDMELDPSDWVLKYNVKANWWLHIVSLEDELAAGQQYTQYNDTIEYRGGSGSYSWSISAGQLPDGFALDDDGVITGSTTDTGLFAFDVTINDNSYGYTDVADFVLYIAPVTYVPGDLSNDDDVNVMDLSILVDYLFRQGGPPEILNTADVDGSCEINVEDVTYLVDYLFRNGLAPLPGCVE